MYDETREYRERDVLAALVAAARAFEAEVGPKRGRAWMDARVALSHAVRDLDGVDLEDLYAAIWARGEEHGRESERALHE